LIYSALYKELKVSHTVVPEMTMVQLKLGLLVVVGSCIAWTSTAMDASVFMFNQPTPEHSQLLTSSRDDSWDYLVYAQQWPPSVCMDSNITHQHRCKVFQNVSTWTVHGVWPTRYGSRGPNFCNKTAKFNPSSLQSIEAQLMKFWPNLYTDEPLYQFWEHEWTKHGTCAMQLSLMGDELKYFSTGLKLNHQLDLLTLLEKQGLPPKEATTYQYFEVLSRVEKAIGKKVKLQCTLDKNVSLQYLLQVEVCLNKQLQPIDCTKSSAFGMTAQEVVLGDTIGCLDTYPIAYTPIQH
jgi:ribonuclease T2